MKRLFPALACMAALMMQQPAASQQLASGNTTGNVVTACGATAPYAAFVAGRPGPFTVDTTGVLCTAGGGGGGGGLSVTDQAAFTQGVSQFTPGGGVFNDAATLTSGQQGTYRLTAKRGQIVDVDTSSNNLYAAITSSIPAGSNVIGGVTQSGNFLVGTYTLSTFFQPAVSTTPAYSVNDVVGGLLSFPNAARLSGGTGMLTGVTINFQDTQTAAWNLYLFDSNPSSSTFTDNQPISIAAADINKLVKVVTIANCFLGGTTSSCQASGLSQNYQIVTGTTLFGVLTTLGTPTFGVTNDAFIRLTGQQN